MAKFHGKIGFIKTVETSPGIWEEQKIEKVYSGDILKNSRRWTPGQSVNDEINITNEISIIADSFATTNSFAMKYIEFMGSLWKISSIEVQAPRLILSLGGIYNA